MIKKTSLTILILVLICSSCKKAQNIDSERNPIFPVNCTEVQLTNFKTVVFNNFRIDIPKNYSHLLKKHNNGTDILYINKRESYTSYNSPFITVYKMDDLVNNLNSLGDVNYSQIEKDKVLNPNFKESIIKIPHVVSANLIVSEDVQLTSVYSSVYLQVGNKVISVQTQFSEPYKEFDVKGYCEMINIVSTIRADP